MQEFEDLETFIDQVLDRLEPTELVDLLGVSTEDVLDAFYERVLDQSRTIREFLNHGS